MPLESTPLLCASARCLIAGLAPPPAIAYASARLLVPLARAPCQHPPPAKALIGVAPLVDYVAKALFEKKKKEIKAN